MARMHSRKKGKSGSKKPSIEKPQPWVTYSAKEVEQLIIKLAKTSKTIAQIGVLLRDNYGIPDIKKITKKTVTQVLKENNLAPKLPEELVNLIKKEIKITAHLEKNKQDKVSRRGLALTESKIKRLTKYYKKNKVLPQDWKYTREQAKITV